MNPERRWVRFWKNFWEKVTKTESCWYWTGYCHRRSGYGHVRVGSRMVHTHRVIWEFTHGPIPAGLCVLHTCDAPPCVNPAHLFLGTQLDNIADRDEKGRGGAAHGEAHGRSKLTDTQVRQIRARAGESTRDLADEFHVDRTQINRVLSGKHWAHVR